MKTRSKRILTAAMGAGALVVFAAPAQATNVTGDAACVMVDGQAQGQIIQNFTRFGPGPHTVRIGYQVGNLAAPPEDVTFSGQDYTHITRALLAPGANVLLVGSSGWASFRDGNETFHSARTYAEVVRKTVTCPGTPPPPVVVPPPVVTPPPSTAPPPSTTPPPGNPIEPLPPLVVPNPDQTPNKRVPTTVRKQVQIVRIAQCVAGSQAKRAYTIRQVKVTWSKGGEIVRTKFSKRYVVQGSYCSFAVTG